MEADPCADCGTTGGYVERGESKPKRRIASRFGVDGVLCNTCYFKRYRRGEFVTVAAKKKQELKPFLFDPTHPDQQRLVRSVARRYRNHRVDYADLVAEGQIGLMRACRGFSPSLGVDFEAYAYNRIRYEIIRMLRSKASLIRIPIAFFKDLKRGSGDASRDANYAAALKIYECQFVNETGLDAPLANFAYARPEASAEQNETTAKIAELLGSLPKREAKVLRVRFGFEAESQSKKRVGESLGVTEEAVRWLEKLAIGRLREKMGVVA